MRNQTLSHCAKCGPDTVHDASYPIEIKGFELLDKDFGGHEYIERFESLECRGCERLSLRHTFVFAPTGEETVITYPPPIWRQAPRWRHELPQALRELLDEVYIAIQNDARRVALMGARALLDMLFVDMVGDVGSFAAKLQALERDGWIAPSSREVLEAALDAGNAAAHRGHKPLERHLRGVMDIVENLLQSRYYFKTVAAELREATPSRDGREKFPG